MANVNPAGRAPTMRTCVFKRQFRDDRGSIETLSFCPRARSRLAPQSCDGRLYSVEIEADPRVAGTVAPDYSDFTAIRGVQIAGAARRIVAADERMRHLAQLKARYPFLGQLAAGPSKLRQAYARTAVYRLQPARIVLIDNTKGFGHKETLELSP